MDLTRRVVSREAAVNAVLPAAFAAAAAWLLVRPAPRPARARGEMRGLDDPRVVRLLALVLAGVVVVVLGGWLGVAVGTLIAVALPIIVGRLESRASRSRRERMEGQSAVCADLLASCLLSGAPLAPSAGAVAEALGEPVAQPLRSLVSALQLGADPIQAWRWIEVEPSLAPIARAAARSSDTGSSLAPLLVGIADDLRQVERSRGESAARSAGVRAVGPLAACFLPAFVLLGVVPVVASLAGPMLGWLP